MMKSTRKLAVLPLCVLLMMPCATAETTLYEGMIIAGDTSVLLAPCGGMVEAVSVQEGDRLAANDIVLVVSTEKVYAPISGKVIMPFAKVGDAASILQTECGSVLYIEPEYPYIASCTNSRAFQSNEMLTVYPGETVYLRSVSNEAKRHTGTGIITQTSGGGYTITLHTSDFSLNEDVRVYRSEDYDSKSCIGSGRISRAINQAIQGSGVIAAVHVQHGQTIKQGTLLFETVEVTPTYGTTAPCSQLTVSKDCIVMAVKTAVGDEVSQGHPVAAIAPISDLCIRIVVSEDELYLIQIGQKTQISLNAEPDIVLEGTVAKISYLPESGTGNAAQYGVEIAFDADVSMRIGMSAMVTIITD